MQKLDLKEAQSHLPELVEAALGGEEIYIAANEHTIIRLVPIVSSPRRAQFGSAKGLITLSDDFDGPLEDFADYTK